MITGVHTDFLNRAGTVFQLGGVHKLRLQDEVGT